MTAGAWGYLAVFSGSLALSLVGTPLAAAAATRWGVLDHPGGHKSHATPTPYLGGTAMLGAFALAVLLGTIVLPATAPSAELLAVMGCALGLSLVGLVDDIRGLGPFIRLAAELAAAVTILAVGPRVELFGSPVVDALLTVVWVVGICNAFNFLDNMDGLAAGVAAIAAGFFFLIAAVQGQFLVATLSIALAGCTVGFLRHNFHPARIYMGDSGSVLLGFLLAVIGIKLRLEETPQEVAFFVPVLVLGVAVFDACLVTSVRLAHRRSPLVGGQDHVSHRLAAVGLSVPVVVWLVYFGAVALGWLGLVMSTSERVPGLLLMGLVVTMGLASGAALASVPVYDAGRELKLVRSGEAATRPPRLRRSRGRPAGAEGAAEPPAPARRAP